ncbi:hypothetical protein HG263_18135 [Pseudoalteromonas sp. JBTF-M23]|uniref:Uncharacterized protein n=1 Tax=Pseudoalteromonas caenipelagi TaxID=2726988 RepID=A0A849VGN4_9GAMM|nr:hypothetical protein [Pseudoalteromonas caenipelagi]NOU52446.1 hypothetical protein [Pseudoalteromonas caenipelagi]
MLALRLITLLPLLYICSVTALTHQLASPPQWLEHGNDEVLLSSSSPTIKLRAYEQKHLYLRTHSTLALAPFDPQSIKVWQAFTFHSQVDILPSQLRCEQQSCEVPPDSANRIIIIENQSNSEQNLTLWQHHYQTYQDPYYTQLPLPLDKVTLYHSHHYEEYYNLPAGQQVSIPIKLAVKLKISVKNLLSAKNDNNKVYIFENQRPVSILPLSNSQAPEYQNQHVSITHNDYVAVAENSRLTLKSYGNALIKIERAEQPFLDQDSPQKQLDSLENPYWTNNLDYLLNDIYHNQGNYALTAIAQPPLTPLKRKRHQQLINMVTQRRFLLPNVWPKKLVSNYTETPITQGLRDVNGRVYQMQTKQRLHTHTLKDKLLFNLGTNTTTEHAVTLFIKATADGMMTATLGEQVFTLQFRASDTTQRIELSNRVDADTLILALSNDQQPVDVAVQIPELAPVVHNELLYMQPKKLADKSKTISTLLERHTVQIASDYLDSLPSFSAKKVVNLQQTYEEQTLSLARIAALLDTKPNEVLTPLKSLTTSPYENIRLAAWKMRINALDKLDQQTHSQRYLEGLLKQGSPALTEFSANALLQRYQETNSQYKLQGLCAHMAAQLRECKILAPSLYSAQNKQHLALWLGHDNQATLPNSDALYGALNYQTLSNYKSSAAPSLTLSHFGYAQLTSTNKQYQALKLTPAQLLTVSTSHDVTLHINARGIASNEAKQQINWLKLVNNTQQFILPIFTDIAANTFNDAQQALSIAQNGYINLKAGESISISSDSVSYITVSEASQNEQRFTDNSVTAYISHPSFKTLLNDKTLNVKTLLNNALYRLDTQTMLDEEYITLLGNFTSDPLTRSEVSLLKRIKQFGHWQIINEYIDYLGTQLVVLQSPLQLNQAEQITRHTSQASDLSGLQIRPYHSFSLDISQFQALKNKLRIAFSPAELGIEQTANITLTVNQQQREYTLQSTTPIEHVFTDKDIQQGVVNVSWQQPFISQMVSVQLFEHNQQQWQEIPLTPKLRFYLANEQQPLRVNLEKDALIKIEYLEDDKREQVERFYSAGVHSLYIKNAPLLRAFKWQLKYRNQKVSFFSQNKSKYIVVEKQKNTPAVSAPSPVPSLYIMPNAFHYEGFINHTRRSPSNFDEQVIQQNLTDVGALLRFKTQNNWYKFGFSKQFNDTYHSTYQLSGRTDWLSDQNDWFAAAQLQSFWQPKSTALASRISTRMSVTLGQRWLFNKQHRHQWWLQPHYFDSSAKSSELALPRLNPDILSQYKDNHRHGWRAGYQYWYQNHADQQLSVKAQLASNQNWQTIDNTRVTFSARQFYQGHIFEGQLVGRYAFNDEHRRQSQWQYLSRLKWHKQFSINHNLATSFSLSWEQNWRDKQHIIALQLSIGNTLRTGFTPFSYAEQPFKTLSELELMQQVSNE